MMPTWIPGPLDPWIPGPLDTWEPSPEEVPHLKALARCVEDGFRFLHMPTDGQVVAIHAERRSVRGVAETIIFRHWTNAVAARTRLEDYPDGHPLWQAQGSVAEVIGKLLELPPHGTPGAPVVALKASALWRPGDKL